MKKLLLITVLLMSSLVCQAQTFADFLVVLEATSYNLRQAKVDSFVQATSSFPITEDTLAHFVYKGPGGNLAVPGDFSGWNPNNAPMTQVQGTNFWYRSEVFANNARLDYKYVYDGANWILDPRNPFRAPGGFGDNSELRMPAYIPPVEVEFYANIPHGTLQDTVFFSSNLNNSRQVRVYLPPGYNASTDRYPVALVHDGLEYITLAKMNNTIDYLIAENRIQPVIAVFVPPVNRSPEYIDNQQNAFTAFISSELMPWLDGRYRTKTGAENRLVMGSSAGGNISLWIAMQHPEIFGHVGAFSPYVEPDILVNFNNSDPLDLRIYMLHGSYDHITLIHQSVNNFLPILASKGYDHLYEEFPEGHSYGFWRAHADDALIFAFPAATAIGDDTSAPESFDLQPNFPNPFNPTTNIGFRISDVGFVTLEIYDITGELVKSLVRESRATGSYVVQWDGTNQYGQYVSSGVYFYRLQVDNQSSAVRKMVLMK